MTDGSNSTQYLVLWNVQSLGEEMEYLNKLNPHLERELDNELIYINRNYEISAGNPGTGSRVKRWIGRLLFRINRIYLDPLIKQQTEINAHMVRALNSISEMTKNYDRIIDELQHDVAKLNRQETDQNSSLLFFEQERTLRQQQFELLEKDIRAVKESVEELEAGVFVLRKELRESD